DDAEEAGVAGGQHGGGANASGDDVEGVVQVLEFSSFCVRRDGGYPQVTGRADDQPCAGQGAGRVGAERAAVAADHGDVLVSGGAPPPTSVAHGAQGAASAISRWPVKSTMMTRMAGPRCRGPACSPQNRLSTRAARAHSSRPASWSRPAWSQSSAACRAV